MFYRYPNGARIGRSRCTEGAGPRHFGKNQELPAPRTNARTAGNARQGKEVCDGTEHQDGHHQTDAGPYTAATEDFATTSG